MSVSPSHHPLYANTHLPYAGIRSSGSSAEGSIRDIPQYDPTEYEPNNPMLYGAYRRWKLAETEEKAKAGKGKGKKGSKKGPGRNSDR